MSSPSEPNEDEPEIHYVPGAANHYDYEHDVVVLDERLKDYPVAHDYIKEHELRHASPEGHRFLSYLSLELKTDVRHFFSDDEEIEAVRRYFREREPAKQMGKTMSFWLSLVPVLRSLWNAVLRPAGWLYRRCSP